MKPLWQPSEKRIENANITKFTQWLSKRENRTFDHYADLHVWSCAHPEWFWPAVWEFADLRCEHPWKHHVYVKGREFFDGHWFPGMKLNFAENLLRYRDDQLAIIFCSEDDRYTELTYAQLYIQVAEVAAGLRAKGVQAGDRVAGVLPNIPEAIIAMLATTSIGAIWSSCSPDFGVVALEDRLEQLQPKVLFTTDGYVFKGNPYPILAKVQQLQQKLPELLQTVVIPYLSDSPDTHLIKNGTHWSGFTISATEIEFASLPFDHPIYILFSSGTTGKPKCIVHSAGGVLLQHVKELMLHTDVKRDDRLCFYTTCGWMMWNWMVSGLALGTTLVLYEGAPLFPNATHLPKLIDEHRISIFGAGAVFYAELQKQNISLPAGSLPNLKTLLSTGSPLLPEQFDYIYQNIKADICLSSISGGTDIVSCFVLGNPTLPVYRGECQCRGLGMAVEIYNDEGVSVLNEPGELVCTVPFPVMPIGFWNDNNHERYREAYFARFPDVWCHGDYALINNQGGVVMLGRSDNVLKPGGVRIGSAEIYRPLTTIPEILDSLVIGQKWHESERVVLFVKLAIGEKLDDDLKQLIRDTIRAQSSPRHVPAVMVQVLDIPRTINGKLAELVVKNIVHHLPVKNRDALVNPECLEYFKDLRELSE